MWQTGNFRLVKEADFKDSVNWTFLGCNRNIMNEDMRKDGVHEQNVAIKVSITNDGKGSFHV